MKNTAHAQVWVNNLYIFQVFTEYYPYIHIYIKFEKNLIDNPQVDFIFVALLEEVVEREEYVVLARESCSEPSLDSVGRQVSSTPLPTSDGFSGLVWKVLWVT